MRLFLSLAILLVSVPNTYGGPLDTTAEKCLTVLSNNVGIFPRHVTALFPAKVKEKKKDIIADEEKRAGLLARALIDFEGDPDVVLLQEIWSIKARDRLIKDVAEKYPYVKHPPTIGAGMALMQASGLVVLSKLPLRGFQFKEFTKGIGADKVARKGIVGVWVTKDGRDVAVFNTHLQAGGKRDPTVKPDQLRECNEFIRAFLGDEQNAIAVFAGDFNIRSTEPKAYKSIFTYLVGARDSYQEGLGSPTTTTRNEKQPKKRIDFLLTFDDTEAVSTIVDPAGPRISDHLAVFGTIGLE